MLDSYKFKLNIEKSSIFLGFDFLVFTIFIGCTQCNSCARCMLTSWWSSLEKKRLFVERALGVVFAGLVFLGLCWFFL